MNEKHYKKGNVTVVWKPEVCIHSANCVKNLPKVFNPKRKPWIETEHASEEELINTIKKCPSGALSYLLESSDTAATENEENKNYVKVMGSGPLILSEGCTIEYKGEIINKSGIVALCRCGHSNNKPFCDGSHRVKEFKD